MSDILRNRFGTAARGFVLAASLPFLLAAQSPTGDRQPMSDEVFKNVQVLKGIPVNEFMGTMGFFAASLGLNCVYCHVPESLQNWDKFADDVPRKRVARLMIQMVEAINRNNFGGRPVVTCYSCHHGNERPKAIPSLAEQYGVPPEDPNEIEIVPQAQSGPSPDQILDKYLAALGGAGGLAAITSLTARGTYEGYETYHQKVPFELYAKAPAQLTTTIHTQNGDSTTVFDGRAGWIAAADKPIHLFPLLPGAEVDGARLDAALFFPAKIKAALTNWRGGFPVTTLEDREVQVIQGTGEGKTRVKLYFDKESGLLLRQVRYIETKVGTNPLQIDYKDYRAVNGVKFPFAWTVTWTNGQSTYEVGEFQANAVIDAAKFAKPAPAAVAPAKAVTQ
jgi:photosynthetic reaction center cytochrome c subunit